MSLKSWKLYKQFEIQGRCEVEWLNSGRGDCVVGSGGLCNENLWRKPRAEPCKNGEHVYTSTPWAAAVFVNPLAFVSCSVTSMPLRVPCQIFRWTMAKCIKLCSFVFLRSDILPGPTPSLLRLYVSPALVALFTLTIQTFLRNRKCSWHATDFMNETNLIHLWISLVKRGEIDGLLYLM